MCAARLSCSRIATALSDIGCRRLPLRSPVPPRALFHWSRRLAANENAPYTPPFSSPPFTVPPPVPDPPPLRPPTSPLARRGLLVLSLFVAGLGLGYTYWQRNNGGFPLDVMKHVQTAQRLIRDADALPDSSATEPQRLKMLAVAEQALVAALEQTNTRSPLLTTAQLPPPPLVPLPIFIDPGLPPHILALLGTVCQLQGPGKWPAAEQYYLAASRLLMVAKEEDEERRRKKASKKPGRVPNSDVQDYLDGRLLSVGRQLGGLYTLMRSDVAAESVLVRSLQLLAEVREKQQAKQQRKASRPTAKSSGAKDSSWRSVAANEYDDDVTAEISEQLSSVFRMRGDYLQAINWSVNALKMNDKAAIAPTSATASAVSNEDATNQRKVRELHLYTALASDYFSLYVAPPTAADSFKGPSIASPLDNAYHASIHALETLQSLIDATAQPTTVATNGNRARPTKPPSSTTSTSSSVLVSPAPKQPPSSSSTTTSRLQPPIRSAPINLMPSTSHQPFVSAPTVDRLFSLPPSTQRSELLVEAVAAYSNLGSVLCARGEEREAEAAWAVAERAARLTGEKEYLDVIDEQKSMLRGKADLE